MSDFYPRDYQADSINAIVNSVINPNQHLNPVVSAPTGSGKTIIGGWTIASLQSLKPESRILVVTHVKELVRQNARTMQKIIDQPIGIYSAGLRSETRKDPDLHWYDGHDIVCGSIGTIYNKTNKGLGKFDHIIVDEAHRVPDKVDTMYRTLLQDQGQIDGVYGGPHVIGLSATPFRLGKGLIYGPGELFTLPTIYRSGFLSRKVTSLHQLQSKRKLKLILVPQKFETVISIPMISKDCSRMNSIRSWMNVFNMQEIERSGFFLLHRLVNARTLLRS